jgi:hypothetical protein
LPWQAPYAENESDGCEPPFCCIVSFQSQHWPIAAAPLFFALVWLKVINHLKAEWSLNPHYGSGWSVLIII